MWNDEKEKKNESNPTKWQQTYGKEFQRSEKHKSINEENNFLNFRTPSATKKAQFKFHIFVTFSTEHKKTHNIFQ